jgi:uncharacterized membrane protein YkoI
MMRRRLESEGDMQSRHTSSIRTTRRFASTVLALAPALLWRALATEAAAQEAKAKTPRITKEQAVKNALAAVPGDVTDVTIEKKRGKEVYVIEIVAEKNGVETDVLVDMDSGKVIGTE